MGREKTEREKNSIYIRRVICTTNVFHEKQIARIKQRDEDKNEGKYTLNRCWVGELRVAVIKDCSRSSHGVSKQFRCKTMTRNATEWLRERLAFASLIIFASSPCDVGFEQRKTRIYQRDLWRYCDTAQHIINEDESLT